MERGSKEHILICDKSMSYNEKLEILSERINDTLNNSPLSDRVNKENLDEIYNLLHNERVIVPQLAPIFNYENMFMSVIGRDDKDLKDGKTMILTVSEINNFLRGGCLVFIGYILCMDYFENDDLKYRVVVLDES